MSLMEMSLSGAVMIVAIVIIRALAIHKLPKSVFPALWGVVMLRLLIPYTLPSALSVYSLLERFRFTAAGAVGDAPTVRFMPVPVPQYAAAAPAAANGTATAVDPWTVVWLAGALACAAFFALAYRKCRGEFRASLPVDNEYTRRWLSEHSIRRNIEIRQSDRISAPLTYGVFCPVILMPKTIDWEDAGTLQYVLAHEYVHIRRFDAVTKLALTVTLCVHWFNPAVWMMYVLANRDIELSCDEAVVRRFGERAKSAYAMALVRMEETRSSFAPLCNNFSKNAMEERMIAIMKLKKTSLATLLAAAVLVAGVTTAFATSAKPENNIASGTVTEVTTRICYVDPKNGTVYVSLDGGKTFEGMTDGQYAAYFPTPEVEWWTYDEYKEWLENEKTALQSLIGESGWTSGRGEFVWTQELVDEAIAMYEGILEDIKNGMLYSKTIDGDGYTMQLSMNPQDLWLDIHEGPASAPVFTEYEPYGLHWDENEKALFWNGERVRYFFDGAELDGSGGRAIRLEYADAELKGEIDVYAVRERVDNGDGSFDPFGPLTGLAKYSQAEFDAREFRTVDSVKVQSVKATYVAEGNTTIGEPGTSFAERFEQYAPLGITYEEAEGAGGAGNVYYNGQLVSRFADITPDGGAFTFTSAKQGGILVKMLYDRDGNPEGVGIITA